MTAPRMTTVSGRVGREEVVTGGAAIVKVSESEKGFQGMEEEIRVNAEAKVVEGSATSGPPRTREFRA